MAKLTKDQALDGLKKLHALTKEPAVITQAALQEATGLRLTDIYVLKENGILICKGTKKPEWSWTKQDVVPTMPMAERMLSTKVKIWNNRGKKNDEPQDVPRKAEPKPMAHSGIRVYKKYEITKQYGNERFIFTITDTGRGWDFNATGEEVIFDDINVDKLKAIGYALITAADLMEKAEAGE